MAEKKVAPKKTTKPAAKKVVKPVQAATAPAKKPVAAVKTKAAKAEKTTAKRFALPAWIAKWRANRKNKKPSRLGGYFRGAWQELRQVRWPNRKATWSLTLAVILFSVFFAAVILGLDFVFEYLFKEVIL